MSRTRSFRAPLAPRVLRDRQRGAALLAAMLTVTLVATLSAAALWQQWRSVEIESAERSRVQAAWVLVGALDWSRLILSEDLRARSKTDHLGEPWALPLEEARLSSFLAAEKNIASDSLEGLPDAFLSGRIVDAQSRLNVMNLVSNGKVDPAAVQSFVTLFGLLNLPTQEVELMAQSLARALPPSATALPPPTGSTTTGSTAGSSSADGSTTGAPTAGTGAGTADPAAAPTTPGTATAATASGDGPLVPRHTAQLVWLGLSPASAAALAPYVTVLPEATLLNLNTASAEAIQASLPRLGLATARRLVERRRLKAFESIADANALIVDDELRFTERQHGVSTRYFEVEGRLRLDRTWIEEHSLLLRDGNTIRTVWRERGAGLGTPEITNRR